MRELSDYIKRRHVGKVPGPGDGRSGEMDGDKSTPAARKESRQRSSSVSEQRTRARTSSTSSSKGMSSTTKNLMEESSRMATLAAAAASKAHQKKMTDFMSQGGRQGGLPQQQQQGASSAPPGAAGELPSGPCGLAGSRSSSSLMEDAAALVQQMRQAHEQQAAVTAASQMLMQTAGASRVAAAAAAAGVSAPKMASAAVGSSAAAAGAPGKEQEQDDGSGWQVWTNRKNRRVGEDLDRGQDRSRREQTPFRLPGQPLREERGYYTSAARRNQAAADQHRSNRPSVVAALTERQWFWFKRRLCLNCGMDHQVKDCPDLTSKEEGYALLNAAFGCPEDMRPQGRQGSGAAGRGRGGRGPPSASQGSAAQGPRARPAQIPAPKRTRDSDANSGLTPEAKKAKQFSEAVRADLTLYVREKDGSALTEERYLSLKSSFAYYVEDMMSKNKDPPLCAGRWTHSRAVVKIPMEGETDLLWMRCFLDKAYLVQNEEEFQRSKGRIYVAYLRDRLEPELTGMRPEKLANFIRFYKLRTKMEGLFDLKMAVKTPRGKAIHLVMDEKMEEIFLKGGCKIPLAGAGWVSFEDRATYVARIRSQERQRQQPKKSELEKGILAQEMDVNKMTMEDDDVVEVGRQPAPSSARGEPEKNPSMRPSDEAKELAKNLMESVRSGQLKKESAMAKMLEETGLNLDDVLPRRTVSGSSWCEEVEMAKNLEVPEAVEEEGQVINDDEENEDMAHFEMEHDAQDSHRAAGSAGAAKS